MTEPSPRVAQPDNDGEEARRRFWRNLIRVMTVQVVSLLLLWLLQRHYLV